MSELPQSGLPAAPHWLSVLGSREGVFAPDRRFAPGSPGDRAAAADDERHAAAEAELRRAVDDAFAAGLDRGLAQGRDQLAAEAAAYDRLRLSIARLDEAMRRDFAGRLAETVTALCASALAPLALDAAALQRRCAAAARLLGEAQERMELHLHPDDIVRLDPDFAAGWTIVPQAGFARGTVRVEGTEAGVVDGPAEWRAAIEAAIAC